MPEPHQWVLLCLLGGWTAVDGTTWGQFMVSRPLVAAIAAGAIVGAPAQAAQLGLILEVLHLRVLPIGAARYPEGGPAAVVGGATSAILVGANGLLTAVVFVLLWEWVGGETVRQLRNSNTPVSASAGPLPTALEREHLMSIARDFGRGVFLVVAGVPLLLGLEISVEPLLAGYETISTLLLGMALAAGLGATAAMFGAARAWYALAGVVLGLLVVLLK